MQRSLFLVPLLLAVLAYSLPHLLFGQQNLKLALAVELIGGLLMFLYGAYYLYQKWLDWGKKLPWTTNIEDYSYLQAVIYVLAGVTILTLSLLALFSSSNL